MLLNEGGDSGDLSTASDHDGHCPFEDECDINEREGTDDNSDGVDVGNVI